LFNSCSPRTRLCSKARKATLAEGYHTLAKALNGVVRAGRGEAMPQRETYLDFEGWQTLNE
jgi:hypothetical protein